MPSRKLIPHRLNGTRMDCSLAFAPRPRTTTTTQVFHFCSSKYRPYCCTRLGKAKQSPQLFRREWPLNWIRPCSSQCTTYLLCKPLKRDRHNRHLFKLDSCSPDDGYNVDLRSLTAAAHRFNSLPTDPPQSVYAHIVYMCGLCPEAANSVQCGIYLSKEKVHLHNRSRMMMRMINRKGSLERWWNWKLATFAGVRVQFKDSIQEVRIQ